MTQLVRGAIGELRTVMDGPVLVPGDPGFDDGRRVWNAEIDRRPAVIARCASAADVAAAIGFARGSGLEISVRGGAHNSAGTAVCDDGLMLDLSLLNEVTVDPAARRARAGGGALLADLDAATQAHGLAVPAGLIGHTGIGGLTLGGGMGWLTRQFGLTIDNLVSAEVVTAAGQVLRAAHDENPGLFWALRGGGGNFGVVTSFEFRLHEVDPMVRFGFFFWGLDQGPEVLRLAREIVAALPPDISAVIGAVNAPPAPFVPSRHHFAPGYALVLAGFGSGPDHARLATEIGAALPPVADLVTTLPYVELQQMLDEANAWGAHLREGHVRRGPDRPGHRRAHRAGPAEEVGHVVSAALPARRCVQPGRRGRDRLRRRPLAALRCVHRRLRAGRRRLDADRRWVREFWAALRPQAIGSGAGYVNAATEYPGDRVRASYGAAKYERLATIKAAYDPGNVFHLNANIAPA